MFLTNGDSQFVITAHTADDAHQCWLLWNQLKRADFTSHIRVEEGTNNVEYTFYLPAAQGDGENGKEG